MRKLSLFGFLWAAALCLALQAVVPQKWELRSKDDFLKGKLDGISVSYEGVLTLAPKEDKIASPTEEFYLSALVTPEGITYLGTGHGGKIYRIGKDGQAELYFQAPEMDVTCLAMDGKGALYAGTSPNGKIYKITEKAKGEQFFDPSEKYIWDLDFMESGRLWAAVGETGGIYEVAPGGEGRMIFKAEENHILCLRKNGRGDVLAGSGGNGVVYRIGADRRASVVFETPFEEVRGLAVDGNGVIYAAASGAPSRSRKEETPSAQSRSEGRVSVSVSSISVAPAPGTLGTEAQPLAGLPSAPREPGALYRISADGMAKMLWSSADEMVYTLLWRAADRKVIFGTGPKGRIYSLDGDEKVSLLLQENSEQVYQLVSLDSKVFVLANNPCYLGQVVTEQRLSGEYLGPVLDARTIASWGRIVWGGSAETGASLQLQTRSGNTFEPNSTWSEWSPPYQKMEEQVLSPKARFVQVRALFKSLTGKVSPLVERLSLFYLQTNIAPAVARLEFLKPNDVFLKLPDQEDVILGLEKHVPDQPAKKDDLRIVFPAKKAERKGFQTVVWEAADENGDTLSYTISLRKEGETEWRVVQDELSDGIYAFDTLSYPDGTYFVKITVSDAPSNPSGLDLKGEKTGPPLVIDNSLPVVKGFTAVRNGASLDVTFQAEDGYSPIEEVKWLVRPGDWRVVFPVDGICDSKSETFKFSVKIPAGAENLVTVRVRDAYGNVGVARQNY
ncbi:MAG: WD40 repeat domain-containing protein [Acidobacteriota bacterium]